MKSNGQNNVLRYLHEFTFSLNLALFSVTVLLLAAPALWNPLTNMEVFIKTTLHIRQTDLVTGHIAVWMPAIVVALCLWGILRATSNTASAAEILRSVAGLMALFAAPIFRLNVIKSYGFPYEGIPIELILILICTIFYLTGKWQVKFWVGATIIVLHYIFLWIVLGGHNPLPGYFGPAGIILSFCSAEVWWIYVSHQHSQESGPYLSQGRPVRV
jgi:hypothetical protein